MKTYKELREEQDLQELNILRTGSALVFGNNVRTAGNQIEKHIRNALSDFIQAKRQEEIDKKLNTMLDGLAELARADYQQRKMLGNMTGIAVSQSILNQRTNKELTKLMKRK
jgi:hypothetical protein